MLQRPQYVPTTAAGVMLGSVVSRYSSRWVPVMSRTYTQRIGRTPAPLLYHWPAPVAAATCRVPPPYQLTVSRARAAVAAACRGLGTRSPFTRGRPTPIYGGAGANRLASGWH